jgi:hypothetical protein
MGDCRLGYRVEDQGEGKIYDLRFLMCDAEKNQLEPISKSAIANLKSAIGKTPI